MRAFKPPRMSAKDCADGPDVGMFAPILIVVPVTPGSCTQGFGSEIRLATVVVAPGAAEPAVDALLLFVSLPHAPAASNPTSASSEVQCRGWSVLISSSPPTAAPRHTRAHHAATLTPVSVVRHRVASHECGRGAR